MFGPIPPERSRWLRLRPADSIDLTLCLLMLLGVIVFIAAMSGFRVELPWHWANLVAGTLSVSHSSTPILFFLGALLYLNRWGRTVGHHRHWLVGGVLLTVPLWFLGGLPLSVRGVGDVTLLLVPWNLVALGMMSVGVTRSLSGGKGKEGRPPVKTV